MKKNEPTSTFAILGAGVLGLTCALTLTKGFGQDSVHIYDSYGFPANNASALAGGMLAPFSELDHLPHDYLQASLYGLDFWAKFSAESSHGFEFHQRGSLLLAHPSDQHLLSRFKKNLPTSNQWQEISQNQIHDLEPSLTPDKFNMGLYMQQEGHLHPLKLMNTICALIKNKHVQSQTPERIKHDFDWVIDCRGLGTPDQDLRGVKGEILIVQNPEFTLSRPIRLMHPRYPLYIVPREDSIFMIGATIIESSETEGILLRSGMELMSALYSLHPSFADCTILKFQSGVRPAYPDNTPKLKVMDNIISCNGLYRHGYLLSPAVANCVISYILNEENNFTSLFQKDFTHDCDLERGAA